MNVTVRRDAIAGWSERDRSAFWAFVRGRLAERHLLQAQLAEDLHIDRSVLTRRLNGQIRERPSEQMVAGIARTLALSAQEWHRLLVLAGYARPVEAEQSGGVVAAGAPALRRAATGPIAAVLRRVRRPSLIVVLGLASVAAVLGLALAAVWTRSGGDPRAYTAAGVVPGGIWLSPSDGETVTGPLHFAARAYAGHRDDPAIAFVEFTVSWDGRRGPWLVACHVSKPQQGDLYQCTWNPAQSHAPAGELQISFDVYDQAKPRDVDEAPNGVHSVRYLPATGAR